MDHHVFLSYSSQDAAVMERVKEKFLEAGFSVWTMGNIAPGTASWKRAIEKAIKSSGCLVAILSPQAKASEWVEEELEFAKLQQIPIFILLASGMPKDVLFFGYTNFQHTDIRTDFTKIESLIKQIRRVLNLTTPPATTSAPKSAPPPARSGSATGKNKTEGVRLLVEDVLRTLPKPYGEDIIEDVFVAIEGNRDWMRRYEELSAQLAKRVVNQMIGWYTKDATGYETIKLVATTRTKLATGYSKLKA